MAAVAAAAAEAEAATTAVLVDLSDVSDAMIIALWKRVYSELTDKEVGQGMTVCKAFRQELPSLVKSILISKYQTQVAPQKQLEQIAATFTNLENLTISIQYSDHTPKLDFSKVSLPHLQHLYLHCAPITSVHFTKDNTPKLQSLSLDNCHSVKGFHLDLPELQTVHIDFMEVDDERGFGRSLSNCPKLQQFTSYKLWGLSGTVHNLNLPECTHLSLYRSDDLEGLKLYAPKLRDLELRACYGLECVRIMPDPATQDGQTELVPLRVNLINANIDRMSKQHLKTHPRVTAPGGKLITKESQDELYGILGDGGYYDDEDEDEDDSDDDAGMDLLGMEGMFPMIHMMGQQPNMDPQLAAMLMQGAPMFAMHGEADEEDDGLNDDEWETDSEGGAQDHGAPDHDDPQVVAAGQQQQQQQQMRGVPAMLAMAMMAGMPPEMVMNGMQMMAGGYGDDSGSGEYDEGDQDEDEYEDAEKGGPGTSGAGGGGPSCTIEEVE